MANCYECEHNEDFNTQFVWCAERQWHVEPCQEQDCKEFRSRLAFRLNASEAVYGFAGWLTCRKQRTVMSSTDDASVVADLVKIFCEENGLDEPREEWACHLKHPSDK